MQIALIALLMEWLVVITTAPPLILTSPRWRARGRVTIAAWFGSLLTAGLLTLISVALAIEFAVDFWQTLEANQNTFDKLFWAFVYSFLPWIVLAGFGIALALINLRLEPLIESRREVGSALESLPLQSMKMRIDGIEVFSFQLAAPVAFAWQGSGAPRIVISSGLVEILDEDELDAVAMHEQAHILQRHQSLKRVAALVQKMSPGIAAGRIFAGELEQLCENAADDLVLRRGAGEPLISALKKMQTAAPNPEVQSRLNRLATKTS